MYYVSIQEEDFNINDEIAKLNKQKSGAVVSFIGFVRDYNESGSLKAIYLDCYKQMAYLEVEKIVKQAIIKFNLNGARVIHKVGKLDKNAQIVLILTSSSHRKEAYEASEFIIDFLKQKAPFFKKEVDAQGNSTWLEPK